MRFVIQRKSDLRYYQNKTEWCDGAIDAQGFYTYSSASALSQLLPKDDYEIFLRTPEGNVSRFDGEKFRTP
jgi:hypothetical protein